MFVYVAAASAAGPSKIGIAADPHKRLRALQTGSSQRLSLYSAEPVGPAAKAVERCVHETLNSRRATGGKEWFDVAPVEAAAAIQAAASAANAGLGDDLDLYQLQERTILAWAKARQRLILEQQETDPDYEPDDEPLPPSFLALFASTLRPRYSQHFDYNDYILSLEEGMWLRWAFERMGKRMPSGTKLEPYAKAVEFLEEKAPNRVIQPAISWVEWSAARDLSAREAHELAMVWDEFAPRHNLIERDGPQWATQGIDDHVDDVHLFALRGDTRRGDRDRIVFSHRDFRVVLVPERRLDLWGDKKWCLNLNPLKGVSVSGFITPVLRGEAWLEPFRPWLRAAPQRRDSSLACFLKNPSKRYPSPRPYDGPQPATCVWCDLPSIDDDGRY